MKTCVCEEEGSACPFPSPTALPGMAHPWSPPRPCLPQRVGFGWLPALPECGAAPSLWLVAFTHVRPAVPSCSAWLVAFPTRNASRLVAFCFSVWQFCGYSFNWSKACFPLCRCSTWCLFLLCATACQRRYSRLSLWWVGVSVRELGRTL